MAALSKTFLVHRLIGFLFVNKSKNEFNVINHLDCDRSNNHFSNLEWTTQKGNMEHASLMGRMPSLGNHCKARNIEQYSLSGIFIARYTSIKEASIAVNGSFTAIGHCCRGISHSSANYFWKYEK